MATVEKMMTADELFALGNIGRCELIRGELIKMAPTNYEHGGIENNIGALLRDYVKTNRLGRVLCGDPGFIIERDPDTVRAPDVAFVRAERDPPGGWRKFFPGPPDLAVEVLSPDDRAGEVNVKVQDWLKAGCLMVWTVDPQSKTVTVYRNNREATVFAAADTLIAEDLLPGFSLPVAEIFA
ncbi:MAG: Uma2 family endonuclease [Pirellulales bacterium]|nr:Uma2 family endonuclease [Pirellulales bacterium]